jgi:UDP-N-acetylglucosamine transferase subunit ALG13
VGAGFNKFSKGSLWGPAVLIFVSVGTQDKSFNRLIEGVDRIAHEIDERIVVQIGNSSFIPKRCDFFRFCTYEELLSHIAQARLVISQAGFGIIGNSIRLSKPMILVPREMKFGEAVDRQYELAEYLAGSNESILCVRNIDLLAEAIHSLNNVHVSYNYSTSIPQIIDNFLIDTFSGKK